MKLLMIGCSHHDTPVEIRERLAFSHAQARDALDRFRIAYPDAEAVLLSTCNRTELYTASLSADTSLNTERAIDFLGRLQGIPTVQLDQILVRRIGLDAVRHLFRVASSLDSMVLGEAQILSQVKSAYELSASINDSMPVMNTVFQHALRVAKRVSTETAIQQKRVSIPSVAVADFAKQIFERFDDKRVLVLGAGEMAEETLNYLKDLGVRHVTVANRNTTRGQNLAQRWNAAACPWENRVGLLAEVDIVVTATGAEEPIVTLDHFRSIERERAQRPLFILDLAVPRDIDPAIADCLGVYLFTVDDLREVCEQNRAARQEELPKANRIIDQEASRFQADWNVRASGLTIKQLRSMANEIKSTELHRLLGKLNDLDEKSHREIEQAFDRLVNKLLHPPLESLRDEAHRGTHSSLLQALKRLFQLND